MYSKNSIFKSIIGIEILLTVLLLVLHKLAVVSVQSPGRFFPLVDHHFPYSIVLVRTVWQIFRLKKYMIFLLIRTILFNWNNVCVHNHLPPYKSKKSPLFWILMWVTSCPRRTDNVNAPGFEEDNRAKNEPSNPRSNRSVSASTPLMEGWNHLQYSIYESKLRSFKITQHVFLSHRNTLNLIFEKIK